MNQRTNGAVFVKLEEIELSDLLYLSTDSSLLLLKSNSRRSVAEKKENSK